MILQQHLRQPAGSPASFESAASAATCRSTPPPPIRRAVYLTLSQPQPLPLPASTALNRHWNHPKCASTAPRCKSFRQYCGSACTCPSALPLSCITTRIPPGTTLPCRRSRHAGGLYAGGIWTVCTWRSCRCSCPLWASLPSAPGCWLCRTACPARGTWRAVATARTARTATRAGKQRGCR